MTMSEWNMHSLHSYGYWSMEQGDWRPRQGRGANILQSELNLDNIINNIILSNGINIVSVFLWLQTE